MDEQPRLPGSRGDEPALAGAGLQGARDRSPDRPDAPSRLPSPGDGRRRPVAHDIRFQVHPVAPDVIHLHGLERPGADVEIELGHGDALRAEPRQQLKREVQPRGGRGDAAVVRRPPRPAAPPPSPGSAPALPPVSPTSLLPSSASNAPPLAFSTYP